MLNPQHLKPKIKKLTYYISTNSINYNKTFFLTGTRICSIESLSRIVTDWGSTKESKSTVIQYGTAISSVLA